MKEKYNVVVVGAGPAGSMVARAAARGGARVLLIDRRRELGVPVQCGEALAEDILKELKITPDFRWAVNRTNAVKIVSPSGIEVRIAERKVTGKVGYILDRKVFDKFLVTLAAKEGADVMVGTFVDGLITEDGKPKGVRARGVNGRLEIKSDMVVAADGVGSRVARWAGLNTTLKLDDIESGIQFQMVGIDFESPSTMEFYLGSKIAPGGYCLTEGAGVVCKNTIRPIETLKMGDEVLTYSGLKSVAATMSRPYAGKVVAIVPSMFNDEVQMTPDHLVLIWNEKKGLHWKRADNLVRGQRGNKNRDYLVIPKMKAPRITHIDIRKYVKCFVRDGKIYSIGKNQFGSIFPYKKEHSLPAILPLTPELVTLFGYYLSEGSIRHGNLVISSTDERIIQKVTECAKKLGFKFHVEINRRKNRVKPCTNLNFSRLLGQLFESLFGKGAARKGIPYILYGMDDGLKETLVKAIFEGDGCKERRARRPDVLSLTTTSKRLAHDLWTFLISIGIVASLGRNKRKNAYTVKVTGKQILKINPFGYAYVHEQSYQRSKVTEEVVYLPIRKLSVKEYSGIVWDIQSGGSFCVPFVVHNCWIFPKGEGMANVGLGVLGSRAERRPIEYLRGFVARMPSLSKGKVVEINGGGDPVSGPLKKTVKDNLLVVGDAARQVNALTGGGIDSAMRAGNIAGEVAAKAVSEGNTSEKRLGEYEKRWREQMGERLERYLKAKNVLLRLTDEELDQLAETLSKVKFDRISLMDMLKALMKAHPKLLWKLRGLM